MAYNMQGNDCIVCAVMDARCSQVYNALFRINGNTVERITEDRAISLQDLKLDIEKYSEKIILVGDGAEITKTKEVYVFRVQGSNETLGNTYTLQMPEGTTEISRISNTQEDWKYQDTTVDEYTYESEVTIKATNGAERTYLIAYKQVNN